MRGPSSSDPNLTSATLARARVSELDAELVSTAMFAAGASAVEERDNGDGTVTLVSDVAPRGPWPVETIEVDDDVLDAWRPFASAWRAAPDSRVVVRPPWVQAEDEDGDIVLTIDPGRAFGSGSHETTRLSLALLEAVVEPGASVLDVGCGSGVLAIATVRLGASRAVAVDVNREALRVTALNARANGVEGQVSTGSLAEVRGTYDIVVANISAATIAELAAELAERVAATGTLILSGYLTRDRERIAAAFPGWHLAYEREEGGWLASALCRPPSRSNT